MTVSLPVGASATVRVPATSANLGPGFDVMGLALSWYDTVRLTVQDGGLSIEVSGEGSDEVARDETHLVIRAVRGALGHLDAHVPGLTLECSNTIPHGRGLGSSAAAVVAGLFAARALVPGGELVMDDAALLRLASQFEGHPDNVAACLLGGFTLAWGSDAEVQAVRLPVASRVMAAIAVPGHALSTHAARGMLPASVPHAHAASNAARAALLVAALTHRPDLLLPATVDLLHQDYREAGMPASLALVRRLRSAGHAAVISGAGPSVLVLGAAAAATAVRAESEQFAQTVRASADPSWVVRHVQVDATGTTQLAG